MQLTGSDLIAEALFELISNARDEDVDALRNALRNFKGRYPRSVHTLKQQRFASNVLCAMQEGCDYRDAEWDVETQAQLEAQNG